MLPRWKRQNSLSPKLQLLPLQSPLLLKHLPRLLLLKSLLQQLPHLLKTTTQTMPTKPNLPQMQPVVPPAKVMSLAT